MQLGRDPVHDRGGRGVPPVVERHGWCARAPPARGHVEPSGRGVDQLAVGRDPGRVPGREVPARVERRDQQGARPLGGRRVADVVAPHRPLVREHPAVRRAPHVAGQDLVQGHGPGGPHVGGERRPLLRRSVRRLRRGASRDRRRARDDPYGAVGQAGGQVAPAELELLEHPRVPGVGYVDQDQPGCLRATADREAADREAADREAADGGAERRPTQVDRDPVRVARRHDDQHAVSLDEELGAVGLLAERQARQQLGVGAGAQHLQPVARDDVQQAVDGLGRVRLVDPPLLDVGPGGTRADGAQLVGTSLSPRRHGHRPGGVRGLQEPAAAVDRAVRRRAPGQLRAVVLEQLTAAGVGHEDVGGGRRSGSGQQGHRAGGQDDRGDQATARGEGSTGHGGPPGCGGACRCDAAQARPVSVGPAALCRSRETPGRLPRGGREAPWRRRLVRSMAPHC